MIMMAT